MIHVYGKVGLHERAVSLLTGKGKGCVPGAVMYKAGRTPTENAGTFLAEYLCTAELRPDELPDAFHQLGELGLHQNRNSTSS
jgi:hypothetical protein